MRHVVHFRPVSVWIAATLAVCGLLGCSMHPLPGDIVRVSTLEIVDRIRCEVQEGLASFPPGHPRYRHVKKIVEGTTIGFEFEFNMDEQSRATGGSLVLDRKAINPANPVHIALSADINDSGDQSERSNRRVFRLFEDLKDLRQAHCVNKIVRANHAYPITGATGMAEVVRTYINLELITDLAAHSGDDVVFSDDLLFTTSFSAGATPDLSIDTPVGGLRITKVRLTGSVSRQDQHGVTVALARDPAHADVDLPPGSPEGFARSIRKGNRTVTLDRMARAKEVTDRRLQTALAKQDAGSRNRVLLELQRRRNLREDDRVVARVLTGAPP
jgi:hypothetical protein